MRALLPCLFAGALAGLAGCAQTDYFLLPPQDAATRATSAPSIAVADISLPSYADALEIAVLTETGSVTLSKSALWADTPRRALTRRLIADLQARLGGTISAEPWPAYDSPAYRLEVIVDRMIGAPEASLSFLGQYVLIGRDSGRITASERFAITVPPQGPGYAGLMAGHAKAIDTLADQIAARLGGRV